MHNGPISYRLYQVFYKVPNEPEQYMLISSWCEYEAKKIAEGILKQNIKVTRII
jgi:hypothetical protein